MAIENKENHQGTKSKKIKIHYHDKGNTSYEVFVVEVNESFSHSQMTEALLQTIRAAIKSKPAGHYSATFCRAFNVGLSKQDAIKNLEIQSTTNTGAVTLINFRDSRSVTELFSEENTYQLALTPAAQKTPSSPARHLSFSNDMLLDDKAEAKSPSELKKDILEAVENFHKLSSLSERLFSLENAAKMLSQKLNNYYTANNLRKGSAADLKEAEEIIDRHVIKTPPTSPLKPSRATAPLSPAKFVANTFFKLMREAASFSPPQDTLNGEYSSFSNYNNYSESDYFPLTPHSKSSIDAEAALLVPSSPPSPATTASITRAAINTPIRASRALTIVVSPADKASASEEIIKISVDAAVEANTTPTVLASSSALLPVKTAPVSHAVTTNMGVSSALATAHLPCGTTSPVSEEITKISVDAAVDINATSTVLAPLPAPSFAKTAPVTPAVGKNMRVDSALATANSPLSKTHPISEKINRFNLGSAISTDQNSAKSASNITTIENGTVRSNRAVISGVLSQMFTTPRLPSYGAVSQGNGSTLASAIKIPGKA
jgi:hypothetical protein